MFCSICGKTIQPEDKNCPHCGVELGDVRFPGIPYTSVQFRIVPGKPMSIDKAYAPSPYTRTSYSVQLGEDEEPEPYEDAVSEENADSATTYRPVMEDEAAEEAENDSQQNPEAQNPAKQEEVDPEKLSEEDISKTLQEMKEKGLDTEAWIQSNEEYREQAPDQGLNQRMAAYENDLKEEQNRRARRGAKSAFRIPFIGKKNAYSPLDDADERYAGEETYADGEQPYDEGQEYDAPVYEADAADTAAAAYAPAEGEYAAQEGEGAYSEEVYGAEEYGEYTEDYGDDGRKGFSAGGLLNATLPGGLHVATIAKIAGGLIVAVLVVTLGLKWFGYVNKAQQKAPIDGVSYKLYNDGISAITEMASSEKVAEMLETYTNEGIGPFTMLVSQQNTALNALMPEEQGLNDQLFMNALLAIEDNIANAVTLDGLTGTSGTAESAARWETINTALTALKTAKDTAQLQAIVNSEKIDVTVAEVTPTPAPKTYTTLTRGDQSEDVRRLQQRLYELGYLSDAADGIFGNKTTTAIKYFQMGHNMTVSGIADAEMQEMLFSDAAMDYSTAKAAYQARLNGQTLEPTAVPQGVSSETGTEESTVEAEPQETPAPSLEDMVGGDN